MSDQTATSQAPEAERFVPAPIDFHSPQLTVRAALTGMVLGATLSICNVYLGLKIGWGINVSITGILVAFAAWNAVSAISNRRISPMGKLENNINQSACSAAGSVSSAGLVSAIPALMLLEDDFEISWLMLATWIFVVCMVGITVATGLRREMIINDKLPFPTGIACAETIKEIYNKGSEAMVRVSMLAGAAAVAAAVKVLEINQFIFKRTDLGVKLHGSPAAAYGFSIEPTLLMYGVGGLIGLRATASLIAGAIIAFAIIGPELVDRGLATPGFSSLVNWLLWPGVTLMVVSSLVSFSFSMPRIIRGMMKKNTGTADGAPPTDEGDVSHQWFIAGLGIALVCAVILQVVFFGIVWWAAVAAVLLSFVLAIVAARVSGETNVTPVGPMGKVTQLMFAVMMPKNAAANLMSASVTAGASSQAADLMHDFRCGYILGAVARKQVVAQILGAFAGALVGSAAFLLLIDDPKAQLLTEEWPAPAVATWKAVAEVFRDGIENLPDGALRAMLIAAVAGVVLPTLERVLPAKVKTYIPSAASMGLGFVITPAVSMAMFIGAVIAFGLEKVFKTWTSRFLITICAGIVAGESLTGAGHAVLKVVQGMSGSP